VRTEWKDGDRVRVVELEPRGAGRFLVRVDDAPLECEAQASADGTLRLVTPAGVAIAEITASGTRRFVHLAGMDFVLERESGARRRAAAGDRGALEAPMPGMVTRVMVAKGDAVEKGQPLVALEAMKMEHVLRAPRAGRVKSVAARQGEMASPNTPLVELEEP
jgi:3-methylcrotonyl-CoA carboxylase alpha subunit